MTILGQKTITGKVYSEIREKSLIGSGDRVMVAVSGGADSICLLSVMIELNDKLGVTLSVCHFNHRLRGVESDADEKFVRDFCVERGIECFVGRAEKKNNYKSENEARVSRYAFFEKFLAGDQADRILLAHNLNDQAETVLLRLIRGSGFRGLKAIPSIRQKFSRPLLPISRSEIEKYLKDKKLEYRTDSSNLDTSFARNKIRAQILPQIADLNPNIIETLGHSALVFEEDYNYLEQLASKDLSAITAERSATLLNLDYHRWLRLHPAMKRLVLRLAISQLSDLTDVTVKQIDEVVTMLQRGHGKKWKALPHSLRISLEGDKIKISLDK